MKIIINKRKKINIYPWKLFLNRLCGNYIYFFFIWKFEIWIFWGNKYENIYIKSNGSEQGKRVIDYLESIGGKRNTNDGSIIGYYQIDRFGEIMLIPKETEKYIPTSLKQIIIN